jgi:hypothetical protein
MLGLAGPFIGDETFSTKYQKPLHDKLQNRWYQVETTDQSSFDGTVEGYNTDNSQIFIDNDLICGVEISKLPDSYGMHDLRNYHLFFQGHEC